MLKSYGACNCNLLPSDESGNWSVLQFQLQLPNCNPASYSSFWQSWNQADFYIHTSFCAGTSLIHRRPHLWPTSSTLSWLRNRSIYETVHKNGSTGSASNGRTPQQQIMRPCAKVMSSVLQEAQCERDLTAVIIQHQKFSIAMTALSLSRHDYQVGISFVKKVC